MSTASEHDGQWTNSDPRIYISPALHAELKHLDLTGRASISNSRVVASGAFGDISQSYCTLTDGRQITVAVKRLRFYLKEDIELIFEKEIYVWSKLHHPNILSLLGFIFESSGYPLLMSEWMPNGSSLNYVRNNNDCDLIRLVTGIAEGLAYLHDKGIVHSDIKPDNIVIANSGDARICDFGGSRIADASKSVVKPSTGIRGTPRYLAYELIALLDQYPRHTKESDVWAFGMTVFALIAQEHPYALFGEIQVQKAIADCELPSFHFWTARSSEEKAILQYVCNLCWIHEPSRRATMPIIIASLCDSQPHASRPLNSDDEEQRDAKRRRVLSSAGDTSTDTFEIIDNIEDVHLNENGYLYKPLVMLSSKLVALDGRIDTASEIYQYLHSALKVTLSLHNAFTEEFQIDGKLDHLMRAMADVMALITARSITSNLQNGKQTIIRLLQQAIECCLFVNKYSRKSFEERKFGASDGRKMTEFISFFVVFKEALELGTGVLPTFVSSRVVREINEYALRQRLNPIETDTKGQQQCLLGTRVEVQEQIIEWVLSATDQNILWLHGVAGSGKSTVVASIAEHFRGIYRLGAFLRFTRGASDPSSVISTIAFKLTLFNSTIGSLLLAETDRDKDVANASLTTQLEKLLVEPLVTAANAQQGPVVVALDALDECGTPVTRRNMMQVLLRGFQRLPSNFKFIITSRREQDIDRAFNSLQSGSVNVLELDYRSHLSRRDVQLYLTHEIHSIIEYEGIPEDKILEGQLSTIVQIAAGLFGWASTIVKLASEHDSPLEKLAELASNVRSLSGLDQLYSNVLSNSGISWRDVTSRTRFQRVIGLILLSKTSLTESMVDAILGPSIGKCRPILSRLRSVIDYKLEEPIRLFHTSFADFLMSTGHNDDWFINIPEQESFLATRCFEIMTAGLRFNICDLKSSFIRNDVDGIEGHIESRISPHVSYACTFWAHHLCQAPYGQALIQKLSEFLYGQLLYWLEVLSLVKKVSVAGPALLATTKWIGNNEMEITAFVRDARRMISIFALPISQSVPHIYLSMLPLTADDSRASAHYLQHTSSLVQVTRMGEKRRSPLLKLLEGHTGEVNSVNFSPDGSFIGSGSTDKTVRIWDMESGEPVAGPFDAQVGVVRYVSFLPDGSRIVVGGEDGIAVLDVESGNVVVGPFGAKRILCVAVSPGGNHIVSTSSNEVNMWDLESGMIVGEPFFGHTDEVRCVAYSQDGRFIVSSSADRSIRVWEVENRRLIRGPFLGHTDGVMSADFSPDGKYVVSGSYDKTIKIWDLEKGEVVNIPFTEYECNVRFVAYSSDGTRIGSGSLDTVRIWNAQNGQLVAGPFKHTNDVFCVAFSPDGTRVVSGSEDGSLQIWDAESGKINSELKLIRHVGAARFSVDSSSVISDNGTTWYVEDGMVVSEGSGEERRTLAITNGMQFSFEGTLEWNPYTGRVTSWDKYWDYPNCIAISPNEKRFAFGSSGGSIRVWDVERDVLVRGPFDGHDGQVNSLTFSPDDRHIASAWRDVRVWDAETGELLFAPFIEHTDDNDITFIAYSPDGRHIVSGSWDTTIRIWEVKTGNSEILEGHTRGVHSVAYSPDGLHIVSSSWDEIRIWATSTNTSKALMSLDQGLASNSIDLSKWTMDKDGWIRGVHDELLLWVPPDLRPTLWHPQNVAVLNVEFSTALDFSGSAQGERWYECLHPPV